jgi:hypothetical protein
MEVIYVNTKESQLQAVAPAVHLAARLNERKIANALIEPRVLVDPLENLLRLAALGLCS